MVGGPSLMREFMQAWRSRMPYIVFLGSVAPAYYYIFSDRFDMKREWKKEIAKSDIKIKETEKVNNVNYGIDTDKHLVLTMGLKELEEQQKWQMNEGTYRVTHREKVDDQYKAANEQREARREERAKIRALKRRLQKQENDDSSNNENS